MQQFHCNIARCLLDYITSQPRVWFVCFWRVRVSSFTRFLDHTQRRTTVCRFPLDEWSARRRDLYQTTHNTHNRQTSTPPVGFEPTISAGERPQTYALDRLRGVYLFKLRYLQSPTPELAVLISSRHPANTSNSAVLFGLPTLKFNTDLHSSLHALRKYLIRSGCRTGSFIKLASKLRHRAVCQTVTNLLTLVKLVPLITPEV
jgi:hypothetical protein